MDAPNKNKKEKRIRRKPERINNIDQKIEQNKFNTLKS